MKKKKKRENHTPKKKTDEGALELVQSGTSCLSPWPQKDAMMKTPVESHEVEYKFSQRKRKILELKET